MNTRSLSTALAILSPLALSADDKAQAGAEKKILNEPKVEAIGVSFLLKDPPKALKNTGLIDNAKTKVNLLLSSAKPIIDLDSRNFKIESLTDDLGTKYKDVDAGWVQQSDNKHFATIPVTSETRVPIKATMLTVQGKITFETASKTNTKKLNNIPLEKGTDIKIAEALQCEISKSENAKWGKNNWKIELKWHRDISEIAAVRIYDQDDNLLADSHNGSSTSSSNGEVIQHSRSYHLKSKPETLKFEFDLYEDLKQIELPFFLDVILPGEKPHN